MKPEVLAGRLAVELSRDADLIASIQTAAMACYGSPVGIASALLPLISRLLELASDAPVVATAERLELDGDWTGTDLAGLAKREAAR